MADKILYCGYTECGPNRNINQDAIMMEAREGRGLFIVADGMGGHTSGELASALIVQRAGEWAADNLFAGKEDKTVDLRKDPDFVDVCDSFEICINAINDEIRNKYCKDDTVCGSTMVALLVMDGKYAAFSVGDSRIYRKTAKEVLQITQDHVWQNKPEIMGSLSEKEKRMHPDYGKLTNAMGAFDHVKISLQTGKLELGDVFTLCSDGIYKCYPDKDFQKIQKKVAIQKGQKYLESIAASIREYVEQKGAPDNYSLIMLGAEL